MHRFLYLVIVIALFTSCSTATKEYIKVDGFAQGTTYSIVYYDSLNRNFSSSFDSLFMVIDNSMSVYNDSSIISRINRNDISTVDPMLAEVFVISDSVYKETEGAFDITVGPVIRAIGFGKDKTRGIDSAKIRLLLPLIGMTQIRLNGLALIKSNPKIQIDVNAVAQGYTVDIFGNFLKSKGVNNFLVEVGGEICANGVNSRGTAWVVGLDKPIENAMPGDEIQTKISISGGKGLATSGNYRKFIEVDGQKYSHTINPKTGFPVLNSLLSATVIAPSAARADALATAFMVKGLDWSINYINSNPKIGAYLIYSDKDGKYSVWISENVKANIKE